MSSRCWASSSTTSASCAGSRLSRDRRRRTSSFQSGMLNSGNAIDGFDKLLPTVALCGEDFPALGSQTVITTTALARLFDPASLNPATALESIQQRVKRSHIEPQPPPRALLDQISDVIPMPWLIFDEREYQQFRAPLLQLTVKHLRKLIWHSDILLRCISDVNLGVFGFEILFLVVHGYKLKAALRLRSLSRPGMFILKSRSVARPVAVSGTIRAPFN